MYTPVSNSTHGYISNRMYTYLNFRHSLKYLTSENINTSFIHNHENWKQLNVYPQGVALSNDTNEPREMHLTDTTLSRRNHKRAHITLFHLRKAQKQAEQVYFARSQNTSSLWRGR